MTNTLPYHKSVIKLINKLFRTIHDFLIFVCFLHTPLKLLNLEERMRETFLNEDLFIDDSTSVEICAYTK